MKYIVLILSQVTFSFFRTLNVRYNSRDMIALTLLTGFMVKASWIISAAIGIDAFIKNDWLMVSAYLISGILGDYLSFKVNISKAKNNKTKRDDERRNKI